MSVYTQFIIFTVVFLVTVLTVWSVTEINRLNARIRAILSRNESERRVFNSFIHKLATETELFNAMNTIAPQICEELDAESVGIFIPVGVDSSGKALLRGASCTGYFPVFTEDMTGGSNRKIFENLRYRMDFFRNETIHTGDGLLGSIADSKSPRLLDMNMINISSHPVPKEVNTMMALPLLVEDRFAGLLVAVNRKQSFASFNDEDMERFTELSSMIGLTCSLILVYSERAEQDRIRRELEFASELQKTLLPQIPPVIDDIEIAAVNKACLEVSGDFYDYVELKDGQILLLIADATGKGVPACMMTSMCRSFVRSLVENYHGLQSFMQDLNRLLYENSDASHFVTANVIVIDRVRRCCEFASAGHPPMFISQSDGSFETLQPEGAALGMWPNEMVEFETREIELKPGTCLCSFTDGINEALNPKSEEYGMARLVETWKNISKAGGTSNQMIHALLKDTLAFTHDAAQSDDQTVMVISRLKA